MTKLGTLLTNTFSTTYKPKAYVDRYSIVYLILFISGLAFSWKLANFSYHFYVGLYEADYASETTTIFAIASTGLISLLIYVLLNVNLRGWFSGDKPEWILIFLMVGLITFDAGYANRKGIPELAETKITSPTDTRTGETDKVYNTQFADIDTSISQKKAEINRIETKCKTKKCWVEGGRTHWEGNLTKFGRKAIRKLQKEITDLETQKSQVTTSYNDQREKDQAFFEGEKKDYENKLENKTSNYHYMNYIIYALLILSTYWMHSYMAKVTGIDPNTSPIGRQPERNQNAHKKKKRKQRKQRKRKKKKSKKQPKADPQPAPSNGPELPEETQDNVYPLNPNTDSVPPNTDTVQGEGFSYNCTECGTAYLSGRKIRKNEHSFCSDENRPRPDGRPHCKGVYWRRERRRGA